MKDEKADVQFILGQLSGKMDGLIASVNQLSTTFVAHSLSDEKNFKEMRDGLDEDRKSVGIDRVVIARYIGGTVVVCAIASWLIPFVLNQLHT